MNKQYGPFKNIFFKSGIPHKICNAKSLFESKIIKILYYYLKYIDDQSSEHFLSQIINFPKRNIGKATVNQLISLSKLKEISCWDIINNCDNEQKVKEYEISKDLQTKLLPFKQLMTSLISFSKNNTVYETVKELRKLIKIDDYLEKEDNNSGKEQINTFLETIKEMEDEHFETKLQENIENLPELFTLSKFLEEFSLFIDNEENDEDENKKDRVKLMTIHQAKGLEFKYVFIVGLEEGYYPCGNYVNDEDELEEERRIFYVAITRAKINCYLSYAHERLIEGELKKRNQSQFLSDIYDSQFIENYDLDNNVNYKDYENCHKNEFNNSSKNKIKAKKKLKKPSCSENSDKIEKKNL